jgi:hypothetical protein
VLFVCTVYSVLYSEIALSRKPFGIKHMHIYPFLLRVIDTMTSQNIDLSSWDPLHTIDVVKIPTRTKRNVHLHNGEKPFVFLISIRFESFNKHIYFA